MASRTEKQRLLSGSLNLLPPGDKIPDGDALLLDNWRVDQQGCLRSRKGSSLEASQIGSGIFHTLYRAGADRYSGIGTSLYWGLEAETEVASGFDGNPLGIVSYLAAQWVMNQQKQLRVVGSVAEQWGVGAPATPPSAAAGGQQYTSVEAFNYSSEPAPGIDVGYQDSSGVYHDEPEQTTIVTNAGTLTLTNGSATVTGTGTAFTAAMAELGIEVLGTKNGVSGQWFGGVASVQSATELTLAEPYDWDSNSGLSFEIYTSVPACEASTAIVQGQGLTASLQVNASVVGLWMVTDDILTSQGGAVNTEVSGVAQDDDVFRIAIYCANPAAVSELSIVLISGASDTPQTSAYCTMPGSVLNQTPNSWTLISMLRNVNVDSWEQQIEALSAQSNASQIASLVAQLEQRVAQPHFTETSQGNLITGVTYVAQGVYPSGSGYAANPNLPTSIDWSNISGLQVLLALSQGTQFNLDNAYFVGQGALTGSGTYFVSFANAANEDGNLSPASNTVTCSSQGVTLSNIPVSSDPQVTQRWIWRVGFGSSQTLLVGQIADNVTTTYSDVMDVVTAQDNGLVAPTTRNPPPPCSAVMGPYISQLIAWGNAAHPARYYWTEPGVPWAFPGAGSGGQDDEDAGTWEDAGGDDDPIVTITNHNLMALFYKQRSLGRLFGSPDSADYEQTDATVGLVGPKAVANGGDVDYFMGPEGIYVRNFDTKYKISTQLDPIFKGDYVQLSNGEFIPPISSTWIGSSVLELCNDRLYVSYVEQGQSLPSVMLICQLPGLTAITNVPAFHWYRMKLNTTALAVPQAPTALHYDGAEYGLAAGITGNWTSGSTVLTGGFLAQLETGTTDLDGQTIHVAWQSRFSDQGVPGFYKRYADLEIDFQTGFNGDGMSTLTAYLVYSTDQESQVKVSLGNFFSVNRTTIVFSLEGVITANEDLRAKMVAARIEGDVGSTCIIYGVALHWYPEERVAETFDSGFLDLGDPERDKQTDYLQFEMTGTAANQELQATVYGDLPGSLVVAQQSVQVIAPNGRGEIRERLPALVEGRIQRLVITGSGAGFQLHRARLRCRPIGEYLDGTLATPEYFESPEFSVAPGRVGELKDLLLDYDSSAAATFVLYADGAPPSEGLQIVRTITIPAGTRRTFALPFEDASGNLPYGTLFKARIYAPAGGVTRLHGRAMIRARIVGVVFDGSAGEQWLTQPVDLFGGMAQFREVAVTAQTGGPMSFTIATELPGNVMAQVASFPVQSSSTSSRLPVYARLPGTTKGHLAQFGLNGSFWARVYEVKVYGRAIGASEWQWVNVPMEATPDSWTELNMPVRQTPAEFSWVDVPVDAIE